MENTLERINNLFEKLSYDSHKFRQDAGQKRGIHRKKWRRHNQQDRRKRKKWLRTPSGKKYMRRHKIVEQRSAIKNYRKRLRKKGPHHNYSWL
jgi:hypothetical protein